MATRHSQTVHRRRPYCGHCCRRACPTRRHLSFLPTPLSKIAVSQRHPEYRSAGLQPRPCLRARRPLFQARRPRSLVRRRRRPHRLSRLRRSRCTDRRLCRSLVCVASIRSVGRSQCVHFSKFRLETRAYATLQYRSIPSLHDRSAKMTERPSCPLRRASCGSPRPWATCRRARSTSLLAARQRSSGRHATAPP